MAIVRLLKNAVSLKEFYGGYHGTCGETALAAAISAASASPQTKTQVVNDMLAITQELIARKDADATGATTISALLGAATRRGWSIVHYEGYQEPLRFDWHSFLLGPDGAGVNPVIFEVAQAHNLTDTQGSSDEAGVHYHFITVVGVNQDGYICCDGDNPQAENRYSIYSYGTLEAAVPCAMLVLKTQAAAAPSAPPSAAPATGDASTVTTTTTSSTAGLSADMAAYVKAHNITAACVSGGTHTYSPGSDFASFADGTILYQGPASSNQVVSYLGPWVCAALWNEFAGTQSALASAQSQAASALGNANAQIAAMQAQIANAGASATSAATSAAAQIADLQAQLAAQQSAVVAQQSDPRAQAAEHLVDAIATALSAFQQAQAIPTILGAAPTASPAASAPAPAAAPTAAPASSTPSAGATVAAPSASTSASTAAPASSTSSSSSSAPTSSAASHL